MHYTLFTAGEGALAVFKCMHGLIKYFEHSPGVINPFFRISVSVITSFCL